MLGFFVVPTGLEPILLWIKTTRVASYTTGQYLIFISWFLKGFSPLAHQMKEN